MRTRIGQRHARKWYLVIASTALERNSDHNLGSRSSDELYFVFTISSHDVPVFIVVAQHPIDYGWNHVAREITANGRLFVASLVWVWYEDIIPNPASYRARIGQGLSVMIKVSHALWMCWHVESDMGLKSRSLTCPNGLHKSASSILSHPLAVWLKFLPIINRINPRFENLYSYVAFSLL